MIRVKRAYFIAAGVCAAAIAFIPSHASADKWDNNVDCSKLRSWGSGPDVKKGDTIFYPADGNGNGRAWLCKADKCIVSPELTSSDWELVGGCKAGTKPS
jgi:hypothetical protein